MLCSQPSWLYLRCRIHYRERYRLRERGTDRIDSEEHGFADRIDFRVEAGLCPAWTGQSADPTTSCFKLHSPKGVVIFVLTGSNTAVFMQWHPGAIYAFYPSHLK